MLDRLKKKLTGETDAGAFAASLTERLDLPSVYRVVLVHADGGRKVNDTMKIEDAPDIDVDSLTTVGDLADAVEKAFEDRDIGAKLVSPTDADGIGRQMHLKTLRDAG